MSLIINRAKGTSGRAAPGFSYYTGGMHYGTAPSGAGTGWSSYTHPLFPSVSIKARQILSVSDATNAGILPNTDNVAATFTAVLSTKGNTGDTCIPVFTIPIIGGGTQSIQLGTYTVGSADTTIALQLTALIAVINANTYLTGFSATATSTTLTIICPTSLGVYPNTASVPTFTITGAFVWAAAALGVSGTASVYADAFYQISEYYRNNSTGNLWIGFISASSSFQEILALQLASGNQLRQMWIADTNATRGASANLLATVTSIQNIINLVSTVNPFEVVYRPNIAALSGATGLATLPNAQSLNSTNNVQVLISQDGNAQGQLLYVESGYSISNLGANLGILSASRISSSIAQPIDANNASNGIENNVPAFSNGTLLSSVSVSLNQQLFGNTPTNTSGYCYVGFTTYPGNVSGTYFSGNTMFVSSASRYAYMNDNRVWDAITRILQATYIPYLSSEVLFNADGTINNASVVFLQNLGVAAITAAMITGINPPYISGTPVVTINPNQPLQQTNNLLVNVTTEENGIARNITITNGFSN